MLGTSCVLAFFGRDSEWIEHHFIVVSRNTERRHYREFITVLFSPWTGSVICNTTEKRE